MNDQEERSAQFREIRNSDTGKKYRYISHMVIKVFVICLLLVYLVFQSERFAGSVSWLLGSLRSVFLGLVIGYLLNPLDNAIRRFFMCRFMARGKMAPRKAESISRVLGVSLSSLFGIGLVVALIMLIIPSLSESITSFIDKIPGIMETVTNFIDEHANSDSMISSLVNRAVDAAQNWIENDLPGYATKLASTVVATGVQILFYLMDFIIAFIVAIYALLEKENFARKSKKIIYACARPQKANRILDICRHGNKIFGGFLSGKILDSLIIGVLCFIACTLLKIPYAVLVSIIVGFTNIIPFFGPFIGAIPCAAIILLTDAQKGLIFILLVIILQQLDGNIIGPMILGDKTGASAFWIVCSLLFFKSFFGLLGTGMSVFGMIVGVPLFCVIDYIIEDNMTQRLKRKEIHEEELDFKDVESYDTSTGAFVPNVPDYSYTPIPQKFKERFIKIKSRFVKKK